MPAGRKCTTIKRAKLLANKVAFITCPSPTPIWALNLQVALLDHSLSLFECSFKSEFLQIFAGGAHSVLLSLLFLLVIPVSGQPYGGVSSYLSHLLGPYLSRPSV